MRKTGRHCARSAPLHTEEPTGAARPAPTGLHLTLADPRGLAWAQAMVTQHHDLHRPVDVRGRPLADLVRLDGERVGVLIFSRPESTRCYSGDLTYGGLDDVAAGRARYSRWEVLALARVWLSPAVQRGGAAYQPDLLPGFTDRRGVWRSTLASWCIRSALERVRLDYLLAHPPVWLDEPHPLRVCLSYCDPCYHKGTLYRASGFHLARVARSGLETWMHPLLPLNEAETTRVRVVAEQSGRSRNLRARRAVQVVQEALWGEAAG